MNLSQPKALKNIFLTEMWERFSYYGITALLILYINKEFNLSKDDVYTIYGAYGALVYMTPLLGGYLTDKFLGCYQAVLLGATLIVVGHFVVALHDPQHLFFYLGLSLVIVGTGFFTPSINACLGELYSSDDKRRDSGFTIAYMGRNIGTILAPILCAWIAARFDWRYAFIVAGVGMMFGMHTFIRAKKDLAGASFASMNAEQFLKVSLITILVTGIIFVLMLVPKVVGWALLVVSLGLCTYLLRLFIEISEQTRKRMWAALILTAFYVAFMILLQQSGGALNLFTDEFVNKEFLSFHIETGMFQSVEPLAVVILSPLFVLFWRRLDERGFLLSYGQKFSIGILVMSLSFWLLAVAMSTMNDAHQIAMSWINSAYLMQACGELFIGPIGLAMISKLIPNRLVGLFMGIWVLAQSVANYLAALIGNVITPQDSGAMNALLLMHDYKVAFFSLGLAGVLIALLLFFVSPALRRLSQ
jgi:POT family proton-dependent oligopeptide transporter